MNPPLHRAPGYVLKRRRAIEHFKALDAERLAFFDLNPYRPITESDPERGDNVLRIEVVHEPPPRLAILIGDCLHSYRSTLDHLLHDLSVSYSGPIPNNERTEFPIFSRRADYHRLDKRQISPVPTRWSGVYKTRFLHPDAQRAIERLQPYHRRDGPPGLHPLWLLNQLSNEDKHRLLHLVGVTFETDGSVSVLAANNAEIASTEVVYGPVKDGAIVMRFGFRFPDRSQEGKVQFHVNFTPQIAFSEDGPGHGLPVMQTLIDIDQAVTQVRNELVRFL